MVRPTMSPMYEFDSVSVSSFEAAELAATLTAKSAEGWEVAAVVTAGSDVVAYLRRSTDAAEQGDTAGAAVTPAESAQTHTPAETSSPETSGSDLLTAGSAAPSSAADSGSVGWGSTGGAANSGASSTSGSGSGSGTSGSGQSSFGGSDSNGSWGGSAQQAVAPPVTQQQTPAVPAGWYADPAGRFELRYWDGGAWTEHVSRQGQQYTDPPVA